jgi:hypothetical protein
VILYLSRNESANLLDGAARELSLHIRRLSGSFTLSEFVTKDMRRYASCRFFCVERSAITEDDGGFIAALQSCQMMFGARIIVILENDTDGLARELVRIGVTDIVTAADEEGKQRQIAECLSDAGMLKYKPVPVREEHEEPDEEKGTLAESIILKDMEDEQYRFDCLNVKIGVIGATRRVGTTTIAMGLAGFIKNHGGTACYAALNVNRHLESIAEAHGFDAEDDYYTYDAIDFYESMLPKHDYNFIIMDFGDLYHGEVRREAVKGFKDCGVHLLCGASGKRFEAVEFSEALKAVRSVKPKILTLAPNPDCMEFFHSAVTKEPIIVKPVRDMLDFKANGGVFKGIVQPYIVETSKRL